VVEPQALAATGLTGSATNDNAAVRVPRAAKAANDNAAAPAPIPAAARRPARPAELSLPMAAGAEGLSAAGTPGALGAPGASGRSRPLELVASARPVKPGSVAAAPAPGRASGAGSAAPSESRSPPTGRTGRRASKPRASSELPRLDEIDVAFADLEAGRVPQAGRLVQGGETYHNERAMATARGRRGTSASPPPPAPAAQAGRPLGFSAAELEGAVRDAKAGLNASGKSGGLPPRKYGTLLHTELRDVAEQSLRQKLPAGTEFFNDQPLRKICLPAGEANLTVAEWLHAHDPQGAAQRAGLTTVPAKLTPGSRFVKRLSKATGLPSDFLTQKIGDLKPDLVVREPGGPAQMVDLTGQPTGPHLRKSLFYTMVLGLRP
jgi:hypothetical protein